MVRNIRRLGALLLVISLCLPMSKCDANWSAELSWSPANLRQPNNHTAPPKPSLQYTYAIGTLKDWENPQAFASGWFYVSLAAFLWPMGAILSYRRRRWQRWSKFVFWAEPLAMWGTCYWIYVLGWGLGQPLAGAYVSASGIMLYGVAWIAELVAKIRAWRVRVAARRVRAAIS